ncbi:MAG: hypothetical protein R3F62_27005 [Planctomycetota bacterium]
MVVSPWGGIMGYRRGGGKRGDARPAWARTLLAPFEVDPHRVERFVDTVDAPR